MSGLSSISIGNIPALTVFLPGMDASVIVYDMPSRLLSAKPKPLQPLLNFLKPFSLGSWLLTLACLLLAMFVFGVLTWIWDKEQDVMLALMQVYGLLCVQSTNKNRASSLERTNSSLAV